MAKQLVQFDAVLDLTELDRALQRRGLAPGGAVQKFVDSEVIRYCEPKVPMATGYLSHDAPIIGSVIGEGFVVYAAPYAANMYYNPQYHFRTDHHPEAGAYWFERAMAEHKDDIVLGAAAIAGGRKG